MNTNTYATDNYNIDAEQAVLGTIIISSKNAISILQSEDTLLRFKKSAFEVAKKFDIKNICR
jgi:replicative DNA helicase